MVGGSVIPAIPRHLPISFSYIYINLIPEVRGLSADPQERNEQMYSIVPSWTAMSKALLPGTSNDSPDL